MAIIACGVAAMGVLAALAVRADSEAPQASPWLTAVDVAVGLAFVAAGAAAGGPLRERVLVAAVGPTWLAGSFLFAARSLHQVVLAVALVVFPSGRVRGLASWLLVGLAGLAGLQLLPQLGVAALFAAVAAVLAASWAATHLANGAFDPTLALLGHELVLLLVAVAFPLAVRAVMRAGGRLADRLLSDQRFAGLDGLAVVLGDALGDRELRVYRWNEGDGAYVDGRGQRVAPSGDRRWLTISDLGRPVAAVAHRSSALDDPPTVAAVSSAVRLAVTHLRLLEEQRTQLEELEAARARIVAAADRQRERAAAALRDDVDVPLRTAHSQLHAVRSVVRGPEASAAFEVVIGELEAARGRSPIWSREPRRRILGMVACGRPSMRWPRRVPSPSSWLSPMMRPAARGRRPRCSTSAVRRWPTRSSTHMPCGSPSRWSAWTVRSWRGSPTMGVAGRTRRVRVCRGSRTGWRRATAGSGWTARPEPARR